MTLGLSVKLLDTVGTYPECESGCWALVAKFASFSQWSLKQSGLATA